MPTTILIVEDEFLIAVEMEAVVHDLGHESAGIADDMQSALAKASDAIDVALVDVNLADGATGPRIGEKLAADFGIEVIFVTANPAQLGEGVSGTLGALEKPVDLSILKQVLDYVIAVRKGEKLDPPARLRLFFN
ncbi:MAG: response regulator [Sphingomonadaceae bacterium]|nr:response regulator [Sphingomonadaceae bacterium]